MKRYFQISEGEKWDHSLRERPMTTVMTLVATFIPAGSAFYVAVFIDDSRLRRSAWIAWAVTSLALLVALFVIWHQEERGAISDRAKRIARKSMWIAGWLAFGICLIAVLWPSASLHLRIQAGAVLCSLFVGARYLKPVLRDQKQEAQQSARPAAHHPSFPPYDDCP